MAICIITAIYAGFKRWRVSYIGPFYANTTLVEAANSVFFEHFQLSPQAATVVREMEAGLRAQLGEDVSKWKDASVYFGPRIGFGYAAFGIHSPKNLPIWWHPDNSFPNKDTNKIVSKFLLQKFKILIFLIDSASRQIDFTFMPMPILQDLNRSYTRTDYSEIVVFDRR